MGFYWVRFIFWILIVVSSLLLIGGLWKKSWKVIICSGILIILPSLYFGGAENWFRLLVLFPLIPFVLAFYIKNRI
ncbi:CHASE2 domain-containing sensor protein [Metabacillus malikii]|uniref:CHASE2 domain-containing sensor protein n=1 Tax=Metabacillus malikii TaxID=1504265 RepID=A0ABT9ZL32_9BACI|nr:CHASE2 domain-containing sensor protein [Metabacillus malikii]